MIKRQGRGRRFLQTLNICFTKRRRQHAARKPSGVKCRENGTECVRVIAVKYVVDFIRYCGFTTFKFIQSRSYIIGRNVRCHSRVINPVRRDGPGKERGCIVGTGKKNESYYAPRRRPFRQPSPGTDSARMTLFLTETRWCCPKI